jgi:hypothetical protein
MSAESIGSITHRDHEDHEQQIAQLASNQDDHEGRIVKVTNHLGLLLAIIATCGVMLAGTEVARLVMGR